jgi:SpoVK/Ycf46/Vps4 family AAA+-type ATPase
VSIPEQATRPEYFVDAQWPEHASNTDIALFRARLFELVEGLADPRSTGDFTFEAGFRRPGTTVGSSWDRRRADEADAVERRPAFTPIEPLYSLDRVVLPRDVLDRILDLVAIVELRPLVFGEWGLAQIEPNPSVAVNFRGPPGTGKTMAAHAIAERLGRTIMLSRLSDLESKFHGDGPKNLVELFRSAREHDALLFLDEAESLLSRRYAAPDQAAENAINSMRTELLMALDSFEGVVIFSTNLPGSYDSAIDSRLFHVDFPLPDVEALTAIWKAHLPGPLPLAGDVSVPELAAVPGVSGRDVQHAVISAALSAARAGAKQVDQARLLGAIRAQASRKADAAAQGRPLDADERQALARHIKQRTASSDEAPDFSAEDNER